MNVGPEVATYDPLLLLSPLPLDLLQLPQQLSRLILIVVFLTALLLALLLVLLLRLILILSLALPLALGRRGVVVVPVELADLCEDPAALCCCLVLAVLRLLLL